jgi:hypothetical protein
VQAEISALLHSKLLAVIPTLLSNSFPLVFPRANPVLLLLVACQALVWAVLLPVVCKDLLRAPNSPKLHVG